MRTVKFLSLLLLLTTLSSFVIAQTATSSLRGTVTDPKGAVIPGATVTLSNPATGFTRSGKTDAQGAYQFLEVPPSTYSVTVDAPGFAKLQRSGVVLMVNTPATVNLLMQIAGGTITVEVSGEAPLVNTQDASLGNAFNAAQIANLPFEGRDPAGILSLQPGVAYTGNNTQAMPQTEDSRSGAVAGARSDQANITIDGIDNNDPNFGFAFQGALRTTLDSLQEFRVSTTGGNADEGRSSGAQVVLVTKGGTNNFHGSLYEYHRPTFTTANDWFVKNAQLEQGQPNVPGKLIRNTFGVAIGGPIIKDRLFFFANYEGQRLHENTTVTRTVPSANLRQGIVSYLCDPGPGCPASGVVQLSAAQIKAMDVTSGPKASQLGCGSQPVVTCPWGGGPDPFVLQIFNQYPLPNTDTVGDGFNYRGYTFTAPAPTKLDTYIVKLDYNLSRNGNHRVFVRGNLQNDSGAGLGNDGPEFPGAPPNVTTKSNNKGIAGGYTAVLHSNLINNFRYGFVREGIDKVGLQNSPFVNFRGLNDLFGQSSTTRVTVPIHNIADDITWTKGRHTLGFGGNLRIINDARLGNTDSFNFGQTNVSWLDAAGIADSGESLDPAAFGLPPVSSSFTQSFDLPMAGVTGLVPFVEGEYNRDKTGALLAEGQLVPRHFRAHEAEWYVQDSFRVKPNLTLTFGARYTLLQPPYEVNGNQVAPDLSLSQFFKERGDMMQKGLSFVPLVGLGLSGQANGKPPLWKWDYGNIAPRFAFAWSPSSDNGILKRLTGGGAGKFSIRGGYGIYYDHFGEGIVNSFDRNGSFGLTTLIDNPAATESVGMSPRFTSVTNIPTIDGNAANILPPPPTGPFPTVPPTNLNAGGFAITWGLDDRIKTPYSHVANLTITRELPNNFVVEASYVGRWAHRLLQEDDLAMPLDLRDPKSGQDYFGAMQVLAKQYWAGVPIGQVGKQPFFENMFPTAAGPSATQLNADPASCGLRGGVPTNLTATQAMYDLFACFAGNETTALFIADLFCFPGCATQSNGVTAPYALFDPQWSSLYAWRSIGNSNYNGLQLSLRKRMSGLNFDVNYTYSKSIDVGSNAERINEFEGFGFASQIINAWSPKQLRGVSDFDNAHQINANWVYDLPVGRGKHFGGGMGSLANAFIGRWQISGLWRWSSGFPFSVEPGLGFWSTNWQLTSAVINNGPKPKTGSFLVPATAGSPTLPNVFADPSAASKDFRFAYPGESGQRNNFRGPGTFDIDLALGKTWTIREGKDLSLHWETFNVTNTPRFDVGQMQFNGNNSIATAGTFGVFTNTLNKPRLMEFGLRFTF